MSILPSIFLPSRISTLRVLGISAGCPCTVAPLRSPPPPSLRIHPFPARPSPFPTCCSASSAPFCIRQTRWAPWTCASGCGRGTADSLRCTRLFEGKFGQILTISLFSHRCVIVMGRRPPPQRRLCCSTRQCPTRCRPTGRHISCVAGRPASLGAPTCWPGLAIPRMCRTAAEAHWASDGRCC